MFSFGNWAMILVYIYYLMLIRNDFLYFVLIYLVNYNFEYNKFKWLSTMLQMDSNLIKCESKYIGQSAISHSLSQCHIHGQTCRTHFLHLSFETAIFSFNDRFIFFLLEWGNILNVINFHFCSSLTYLLNCVEHFVQMEVSETEKKNQEKSLRLRLRS